MVSNLPTGECVWSIHAILYTLILPSKSYEEEEEEEAEGLCASGILYLIVISSFCLDNSLLSVFSER